MIAPKLSGCLAVPSSLKPPASCLLRGKNPGTVPGSLSSTRTASEGHATVGKTPVTVRRIDDLIARGLPPGFLPFAPTGRKVIAQGNALGSNVAIEARPEGAELNGEEIHAPTYPGRRFALPWAISFCPFGAGK